MADVKVGQRKYSYAGSSTISFGNVKHALKNVDLNFDINLTKLQERLKIYTDDLERGKYELKTMKDTNKNLSSQIKENVNENKNTNAKISSARVKLGVSTEAANSSKTEMDGMKNHYNEVQIDIARLEERLSAATSELDRMRDPANPESNMSMKRHVANDRKEIKRLKVEIENIREHKELLSREIEMKETEIQALENSARLAQEDLKSLEYELQLTEESTEQEKELKFELYSKYTAINDERKTFDEKVKAVKIRLGVTEAGNSVSEKIVNDLKSIDSILSKRHSYLEKKLRDAMSQLELLKSKDMTTKTATSIQDHAFRLQGQVKRVDMIGRIPIGGLGARRKGIPKISSSRSADGDAPAKSRVSNVRTSRSDVGVDLKVKSTLPGISNAKSPNGVSRGKVDSLQTGQQNGRKSVQITTPRK